MKEIGGYFGLELNENKSFYPNMIKLNSGRNAFKYILKVQNIEKVYIPVFICNSMIEPLEELCISYQFYNIDEKFEIVQDLNIQNNERLLYINYFALKSQYIKKLFLKYSYKIIIDNVQAFFEYPIQEVDTIYSPRKFFGVCDGGYLNTQKLLNEEFDTDESYKKSTHLLGRIDKSATIFYRDYKIVEQQLKNQPIKKMSNLTHKILSSIDYKNVQKQRKENFQYLDKELKNINLLNFEKNLNFVPFVYPLMITKDKSNSLRAKLIENKIYIAKYWDEVLERENSTQIEKDFVNQVIALPIDQRYSIEDMKTIVNVIKGYL